MLNEYNIPEPQFDVIKTYQRGKDRFNFEDIFCKDSTYARSSLRKAALRFSIKDYCCEKSNIDGQWCNDVLVLELDHINGISNDNRIENLRWLCPNCHSQTKTFKNKRAYSTKVVQATQH